MWDFYEKINLFEDEDVAGVFKLSWFLVARDLILPLIGLMIVFLFMFPLFRLGGGGVLFFFILLTIVGVLFLRQIVKWYGTLFVVTNKRIFRIVRHGLFKKDVDEIALDSLEGARYTTQGIIQTLARAGTMHLMFKDTSRGDAVIHFISEPNRMLDTISRLLHGVGGTIRPEEKNVIEKSESTSKVEVHNIVEVDSGEDESTDDEVEPEPFFKRELPPIPKKKVNTDIDISSIWKD